MSSCLFHHNVSPTKAMMRCVSPYGLILKVVGYPMRQLLDWTRCPNADLLRRNRTYVLPPLMSGPHPKMYGGCYKGINGGPPPPGCVTHDVKGGENHHLTEIGQDHFVLLLKAADRDGTLLYLDFSRTIGFAPHQLNLSVRSQHLLDHWTAYETEEPSWMHEFCCEKGTTPLRRNYLGKYIVIGISFLDEYGRGFSIRRTLCKFSP